MRALSPELLTQLYGQHSGDPLLTLLTLEHDNFGVVRLVDNTEGVTSRGDEFLAFPFRLLLPKDDGESVPEATLELDNASLDLIDEIRQSTTPISVKIEVILASLPDVVQLELSELLIRNVQYNKQSIRAKLYMADFINTELVAETYSPTRFPGLF